MADTVAKAKKNGRSATVTFRISPNGDAEPVADGALADPLDAALEAARSRGQAKVADILRGEDMLTAQAFGRLIGASHETVNSKRRKHEILGLEGTTRGVRYPRWQVSDAGLVLPGLPQLFATLREPWTVYRFLRTAHAELGGRAGLDALKAGQIKAVMAVAEGQAAGAFA